jgi:hypothetical protein
MTTSTGGGVAVGRTVAITGPQSGTQRAGVCSANAVPTAGVDRPGPGHCETVENRVPWSHRRRRTLMSLGAGIGLFGLAAVTLPDEYGATSATLAALCAFLFVAALVVFVAVPGPGTLETLSRSVPLAGAVLVVAVLLLLSTDAALRWLWILIALVAAAWTASAVWRTRRTED